VGTHQETPFNIDLDVNTERQDHKIGTMCEGVTCGGQWTKEIKVREYGWWTSYTYMRQNKEISCICLKLSGGGQRRETVGMI
jgi:hypothetical protein